VDDATLAKCKLEIPQKEFIFRIVFTVTFCNAIIPVTLKCIHMESENRHKTIIKEFVRENPLATIATISSEDFPQSAAVYAYADDDFIFRFVSKTSTRKYANIEANGKASISFVNENELIFIEVLGQARVLSYPSEAETMAVVLDKMNDLIVGRELASWIPPLSQIEGDEYGFFELKPYQISFYDFSIRSNDTDEVPEMFRLML